jgi:hypothetical protein
MPPYQRMLLDRWRSRSRHRERRCLQMPQLLRRRCSRVSLHMRQSRMRLFSSSSSRVMVRVRLALQAMGRHLLLGG